MLHAKNLSLKLWAEVIHWAVYVLNRTINNRNRDKTPYEQIFKVKLSISYYRVFGCTTYAFIPNATRTKMEAKNKPMIFVGYSDIGKAYIVWDLGTNKVKESSNVTFDETVGKFSEPTPANEVIDWTVVGNCEAPPKPSSTITRSMTRM
jgi:hypothetical protein